MKVVIPVIDKEQNRYTIANGFNEKGCICVYDSVANDIVWYEPSNVAENLANLLPELAKREILQVITTGIKPMALNVFCNSGFTVYRSYGDNLMVNIELFNKESLPIYEMKVSLEDAAACGGSCHSCSSPSCKI